MTPEMKQTVWRNGQLVEPCVHDFILVRAQVPRGDAYLTFELDGCPRVTIHFTEVMRVWVSGGFLPTLVLDISLTRELWPEAAQEFRGFRSENSGKYVVISSSYGVTWVILQRAEGESFYS